MRSTRSTWMVGTLALTLLVAPLGCGKDGATSPKSTDSPQAGADAKAHDSPQAVFDAAKAAMVEMDYGTFCACLTPESQNVMAGGIAIQANMTKTLTTVMLGGITRGDGVGSEIQQQKLDKMNSELAKINDVMAKHGLDEESLAKASPMTMMADPTKAAALVAEVGAKIEDKPAFVGEMIPIVTALNNMAMDNAAKISGVLENVQIDGASATGEIVKTDGGGESRDPIHFEKIDGGWRIDLPLDAMR